MTAPINAEQFAAAKAALTDGVFVDGAWCASLCDARHLERAIAWIDAALPHLRVRQHYIRRRFFSEDPDLDALIAGFPEEP